MLSVRTESDYLLDKIMCRMISDKWYNHFAELDALINSSENPPNINNIQIGDNCRFNTLMYPLKFACQIATFNIYNYETDCVDIIRYFLEHGALLEYPPVELENGEFLRENIILYMEKSITRLDNDLTKLELRINNDDNNILDYEDHMRHKRYISNARKIIEYLKQYEREQFELNQMYKRCKSDIDVYENNNDDNDDT